MNRYLIAGFVAALVSNFLLSACRTSAARLAESPVPVESPAARPSPSAPFVPNQYIVLLKEEDADGGAARVKKVFADLPIADVSSLSATTFLLTFERDPGEAVVQARGADSSRIRAVQRNYIYRVLPAASKRKSRKLPVRAN